MGTGGTPRRGRPRRGGLKGEAKVGGRRLVTEGVVEVGKRQEKFLGE